MAKSHGWIAWYNHMPGANRAILYVSGYVEFTSDGHTVRAAEGNLGINPEPGLFALQLTITEPEVSTAVLQTVRVNWEGEVEGVTTVRVQGLEVFAYVSVDIVY